MWIEISLPLFVGVSGSPNKKFARARDGASPFVAFRPETFNHSHCISRRRIRPWLTRHTIRRLPLLCVLKRTGGRPSQRNFVQKAGFDRRQQAYFLVFGGMRSLRSSMACSSLCRFFQKSVHRSPFSLSRAKIVLMFIASGRSFVRSSWGKIAAETGALGNARTEYGAASGRP